MRTEAQAKENLFLAAEEIQNICAKYGIDFEPGKGDTGNELIMCCWYSGDGKDKLENVKSNVTFTPF